jgi:hypothetical protein
VARRLLNLLTALSLLVCVATVMLWVRSYGHWDSFCHADLHFETLTSVQQSFNSSRGRLWACFVGGEQLDRADAEYEYTANQREHRLGNHPERWRYVARPPGRPDAPWEFVGIHFVRTRDRRTPAGLISVLSVGVPHSLVGVLAMILPAVRTRSWLLHGRQRRMGLCPACGYDLRATPDRCPECGAAASVTTTG